jgi:ABC-type glycerol-3-phosphate transport system substrate-binding protein
MKLSNVIVKAACFCLIIFLLVITFGESVSYAKSGDTLIDKFGATGSNVIDTSSYTLLPRYSKSYQKYQENNLFDLEVSDIVFDNSTLKISGDEPVSSVIVDRGDGSGKTCINWPDELEWMQWDINVDKEGLYELEIEYQAVTGSTRRDIERNVLIDGVNPFREADDVVLYRLWREKAAPVKNSIGNEIWPKIIEVIRWNTIRIYDKDAMYPEPLKFYLTKGKHTIRLGYVDEPVKLGTIALRAPKTIKSYSDYIQDLTGANAATYTGDVIKFEAESTFVEENNMSARRESDADPAVTPISRGERILNVIGGWRWRNGNQSITWEFEVPEDGLYNLGVKVEATAGSGLPVYRRIELDGEVPFSEMTSYKFPYNDKYQMNVLGDGTNDYSFYLTKGTHKLTMTITTGEVGALSLSLEDDSVLLSNLLRKIFLLAGSEPDKNFDYAFESNIPEMVPQLTQIIANMDSYLKKLDEICTKRPEVYQIISMVKNSISLFLSDHYKMAERVTDLRTVQSTMTSAYFDLKFSTDMFIDYFLAGKYTDKWQKGINSNFFQRAYTTLINFIRSFTVNYDEVGGLIDPVTNKQYKVLKLWLGMGMEWSEILKNLADETFTPETGIVLDINLLPISSFQQTSGGTNVLMLALASGNAPDLVSGVQGAVPVELAIRGAAVDLSKFADFKEVEKRFLPQTFVPLKYQGGTYALPESMTMQVLFYRKDIVEELGIKVPETWTELTQDVLPILYRNNMNFIFPADYTSFLFQYGGKLYSDDGLKSALDSPEAYRAFKDFMFMYTGYRVQVSEQSFYNSFRTGESPMGIATHATYMNFLMAAPEIAGRWGIAPVPGTRKADGTVDHSVGNLITGGAAITVASGITDQACLIFKTNPETEQNSWEYLKWWTSDETQTRFCEDVEIEMTAFSRWHTANIVAYSSLPWDKEHFKVMQEMWKWYVGIPVVLGSYFTPRHLKNAWTEVELGDVNPRDALEKATKEINIEMRRKQEEYGIYAGK